MCTFKWYISPTIHYLYEYIVLHTHSFTLWHILIYSSFTVNAAFLVPQHNKRCFFSVQNSSFKYGVIHLARTTSIFNSFFIVQLFFGTCCTTEASQIVIVHAEKMSDQSLLSFVVALHYYNRVSNHHT